ncbi:CLUMA_CG000645, isoform A [Clunio marinus]|uniref:CLUMA_CG000645, isoform A n=1 Tax=Clunio marinus TaxID=568069 RepID=A0A1J1HK16_9DIPT|nr:CLUMA_CG000645, isoform A [Clunio marinus]
MSDILDTCSSSVSANYMISAKDASSSMGVVAPENSKSNENLQDETSNVFSSSSSINSINIITDDNNSLATKKENSAPETSSKCCYTVLKTVKFDDLTVEIIHKHKNEEEKKTYESKAMNEDNASETSTLEEENEVPDSDANDHDDGSDASTIALDDDERIEVKLKSTLNLDENASCSTETPLEKMAKEQENYEGAVGLWGKDYQLSCFKFGSENHQFNFAMSQKVEVQRSAIYNDNPAMFAALNLLAQTDKNKRTWTGAPIKTPQQGLIFTKEISDCSVCNRQLDIGRGIALKGCLHVFCRLCLVHSVENKKDVLMKCPTKRVACQSEVRDDEIKELLTQEAYEKYTNDTLNKIGISDLASAYEDYDYVENINRFQCEICTKEINPGDGIVLKNCIHQYCKVCLSNFIEASEEIVFGCPYRDDDGLKCIGVITDTEMRSLVSLQVYLKYLGRSLAFAETTNPNAYHCKTPNCPYWVEIEGEIDNFRCDACKRVNCVRCKAVHEGSTCEDYQEVINGPGRRAQENAHTQMQIQNLLRTRTAQNCPRCGILTQRIDGCRHMTCLTCKHEFQWEGV